MKKLMQSELYKLFKQKGTIWLFIVGILLGCYQGNQVYHDYNQRGFLNKEYATEQGKQLSPTELLVYADDMIHSYQGPVEEKTYQKIQEDYQSKLNQYKSSCVDEKKMKSCYGEGYQDILNGKVTEDNIDDYMDKYKTFDYMSDEQGIIQIDVFYENDDILNTIHFVYEDLLQQYQILLEGTRFETQQYNPQQEKQFQYYYQSMFDRHREEFESPLSMNMFMMSLEKMFIIPLLICVIIFANCFGQEKQYRVEQLIYTTKSTKYKITLAKIMSTLNISFMYMLIFIGIGYVLSMIYLPIRNLDIMQMNIAQTFLNMSNVLYVPMTYKEIMVLGMILVSVSFLTIISLLLGLSYSLKNKFVIIVIMLGVILGGIVILDTTVIWDMIRAFIPSHFVYFHKYFTGFVSREIAYPYIVVGGNVISYRVMVVVFWSFMSLIIMIAMCFHAKKGKHYYV